MPEDDALKEGAAGRGRRAGRRWPAPPSADQIAAAAEVLVTARTRRQLAAAVTWNAMIAIALILTVAAIAVIIAGILGAQL